MRPDASRTVYAGELIEVTLERWGDREREIVEHRGSVAIVAVDGDGYVTLVRQFREPARGELLELPAGTLEAGEEALETAKRELAEEIGKGAREWRHLVTCYASPGFSDERYHVYLATDLYDASSEAADDERIEIEAVPLERLDEAIERTRDAKSLIGLLWFRAYGDDARAG